MASRHIVRIFPFTMVQHFWWFPEPGPWTDAIKCTFGNSTYYIIPKQSWLSMSATAVWNFGICA